MTTISDRLAVILAFSLIMMVAAFAQDPQPNDAQLNDLPAAAERLAQERLAQERLAQERFAQDRSAQFQPRARSDDRRDTRNRPGNFDFYVLALSWSPSFCEVSRERNGGRSNLQQCAGERPYSFVVHGLWPQHERGFPRDCQVPAPRLSRNIVNTMLDIMPSPRLVFNQWDRHGTCTGLDGQKYFDTVRKARETVQIPAKFRDITNYLAVTPGDVETAFIEANPGLAQDAITVTCDHRRLSEVRICMSKDLQFRSCPEVDRRSCRNDKVMMPPVRGG